MNGFRRLVGVGYRGYTPKVGDEVIVRVLGDYKKRGAFTVNIRKHVMLKATVEAINESDETITVFLNGDVIDVGITNVFKEEK